MNNYSLWLGGLFLGLMALLIGNYFFKLKRKNVFDVLLEETEAYVSQLFQQHWHKDLVYHDLEHTRLVVSRTREIASNYRLDKLRQFLLFAAAWFHDTGQLSGNPSGHEERSVLLMKEFMLARGIELDVIFDIAACIRATAIPHNPRNTIQEIICDADTYNLGSEEFLITDEKLARELYKRCGMDLTDWDSKTLNFLTAHRFYTPYCGSLLTKGKEANIETVKARIKEKQTK
ncbi:metal-dependent phosphohydrolase [Pedobacter petrophilus]|uniref:Metal-dependent phosphohydrolase n=1 Tax=Pedobacter petrophilus TaxID=1908241 RepID=A0A7K0G4H9_9SPHI|nr:HD domain-containing protein [Pedobacter petrophilus]MRX78542.1 metal-dependent phosphohydrolase [Pedobacter petrophilus]